MAKEIEVQIYGGPNHGTRKMQDTLYDFTGTLLLQHGRNRLARYRKADDLAWYFDGLIEDPEAPKEEE